MKKTKYIIIEHDGNEGVIVFSPFLLHKDVAGTCKVMSAGYCALNSNGSWMVDGGSISLGCSARPQDVEVLDKHLCDEGFNDCRSTDEKKHIVMR